MPSPKRPPEYREGPAAAREAESLLRHILTVPKDELSRREAEYRQRRAVQKSQHSKPTKS